MKNEHDFMDDYVALQKENAALRVYLARFAENARAIGQCGIDAHLTRERQELVQLYDSIVQRAA